MSNFLKKSFLISVMAVTIASTFGFAINVGAANVAMPGDLIRTATVSAVYYLDSNLKRHPFHHANQFYTWYANFNNVKVIGTDEMSGYDLGSTIVVRPGTKLVQFVSLKADGGFDVDDPKVYAVSSNGTLMHVDSAATAVKFFGSTWETKILGLPNFLFGYYTVGSQLTSSSMYPTGSLVKTADSSQVYYIDGSTKRPVTDAGLTANRFNMSFVETASDLSGYTSGASVTTAESAVANPVAGVVAVTPPPVSGTGLTVALAADSPGDQVVPLSATSVPLMKFNLTASADGAATINSLQVKRLGVGAAADFSYLYLYDGAVRLTNGKTINSTTHIAQFVNMGLSIAAGTTKTLTLSADIAATTAGNVSYFQMVAADVSASATVNGSFPVTSKTVTLGSVSAGTVKVEKDGTLSNPSVGQLNSKIAQFKLTAGTGEDLSIRRVTLYETGTMNNSYLTNLKLYQNTTLLASVGSVTSKGYVVFDLATPYTLSKNTNRIFYATGDISGSARNSDTITTYLDQTTDLYAVGATYGYGATVYIGDNTGTANDGTYDGTSTNYSQVTVQGGQITVAMNGPVSGTIARGTTGAVLLNFSVTAAINAEIRAMRIELHKTSTDLDTDTGSDCATGTDYIANVKVVDTDNGESTTAINCGSFSEINGSDAGLQYGYTDYFTLTAGKTRNFAVKADLNASLTAGTYYAILGSSLTNFYTFSSTAIKNNDNNQWATDIVPSTHSQGNNQTIAAAALYVSLASNAVSTSVVQGTNKVTLAEFAMQALSGSAITISGMTVSGYVDGDGSGATSSATSLGSTGTTDGVREAGMSADGNVYANNLVTNFRIYDKTADAALATNLNSSIESMSTAGAVTFSNMSWKIPAGETHILAVVADVTTSAFENGDTGGAGTLGMQKYVKVNFNDNTAITAVDDSNNSITMKDTGGNAWTVVDGNGTGDTAGTAAASGGYGVASDTYITIVASGTLNVTAESNPAEANVVAGASNVPMLNLKFQSTNEAFNVNKLRIAQKEFTSGATNTRAALSATISYQNQAGTTVTATQQLIAGNADFNITANPFYVPSNTSRVVSVYFNLHAINQTYAAYTGDIVSAYFVQVSNFEAKGAGSSRTSLSAPSNAVNVPGNIMALHGTLPTFTADTSAGLNLSNGPSDLYKFQVTAAEGTDLTLKKLSFKLSMTNSVIDGGNASTLSLSNFEVLEGSSYGNAAALTQADTGTDAYAVYNGWGVTTTIQTGDHATGGKLSAATAYLYQNNANFDVAAGAGASTSLDIIVVFNDDRLVASGQSKYYIIRASAGNVDTGANSNDAVSMYLNDGDTASNTTTGYKMLEASCDGVQTNRAPGKYCLSSTGTDNDTGAWMIWSDSTGTSGNNTHTDTATGAASSSADWFNGYKIKTLNATRNLN